MADSKKRIFTLLLYILCGILFGFLFPLLSCLTEIRSHGHCFSLAAVIQAHRLNPLLWVIDTAPLFLGILAGIAGAHSQKLQVQTNQLETLVEARSKDVIRQKLFYEALVENNPIAVVTLDKNHRVLSVNPAFKALFGFRQDEIMGKNLDSLIANSERPEETSLITDRVLSGKSIHEFGIRKCKNGQLVEVEIFGEPITVNKSLIGVLGLYRDITLEKRTQKELASSEERFRRMFMDSPIALRMEDFSAAKVWIEKKLDSVKGSLHDYLQKHPKELKHFLSLAQIIDINAASLHLFKAESKTEIQERLHSILSCESQEQAITIICAMLDGKTSLESELVYTRQDGKKVYTITKLSIMPGYEDSWARILFSNMDITDRKMSEERLTYISLHDIMTAVYNRAFFEEEMVRLEKSRLRPISILIMDMDNLKTINDRDGHPAGDNALQTIADVLRLSFRTEDLVARIGGDEFAVLLPGCNSEMAQKAKNRVLNKIIEHNAANKSAFPLGLSIGCATADKNVSLEKTFKLADEAMYQEKQSRKISR